MHCCVLPPPPSCQVIAAVEDTVRVVDANEALPTSVFEGPILRCLPARCCLQLLWLLLWPARQLCGLPGLLQRGRLHRQFPVAAGEAPCLPTWLPAWLLTTSRPACRLAASPCGRFVAGYAQDATIHIWTAGARQMLAQMCTVALMTSSWCLS